MACPSGLERESAFLETMAQVRSWKVLGQHPELYDAQGDLLARIEARHGT